MNLRYYIALGFGCGLVTATVLHAQSGPPAQKPNPPANPSQQQPPAKKPADSSNQFPQDTNDVPVVPTSGEPVAPQPVPGTGESAGTTTLLHDDTDPVHSPDDPPPGSSDSDSGFSSSLSGANDVNIPDETKPSKRTKRGDEPPVHQETAKEDEDVGAYELGQKNWKAALSRFQSAVITDAENPDVYWGLAEAQRNIGDYANAKVNYEKVMEYDPDSKHGKEAKKWLKEPQMAKAPAVSKNQQSN
jgi:tetratricopeptide (TPR) repeat protein